MRNLMSKARTTGEISLFLLIAYVISVGAHEMYHIADLSQHGFGTESACFFGFQRSESAGISHVANGWVIPNISSQEEFDRWEDHRQVSEYGAYFTQGAVFMVSWMLMLIWWDTRREMAGAV